MEFKRRLKSLGNKTGRQIQTAINSILADHDKYQKCYFWTQTGNAASRRRQEFNTELTFNFLGIEYVVEQSLTISCKNFYYSCDIRKDGKKSNITALKRLV